MSVDRLTPLAAAHAVPQEDLDNATQNLAVTKADLVASLANLRSTQVGQKSSIESAHAALLSAQAELTVANLNLSYCTISSPATGIIGFVKFDVGNVVGEADSQILDTLSTIDPIQVQFSADENTYLALVGKDETYNGTSLGDQPLTWYSRTANLSVQRVAVDGQPCGGHKDRHHRRASELSEPGMPSCVPVSSAGSA